MSDEKYYKWIVALTIGAGLSLMLIIFATLPRATSEPSIEIHKWHDVEEEVTCYWAQPRYDTVVLSCVREKEQEE